jgi:SMODS and SLOG-associating 2TM effector domain family 4
MEQNSHHNEYNLLESQLRENYGKIVYSHKTQEKCADILTKRNNRIKNAQIILAALITTGLLVRVFKGEEWALIISTILSAIQFGLTSFLKEYNLGETIQKHTTAALELLDIREQYLSLLTDLKARLVTTTEIIEKREALQIELSKTYKGSPRTFSEAYSKAQKALQVNEELTFSDAEIDKFLPATLRKT